MLNSHRFCIAPMIDCTDRHFRYLARLLTRHTRLYTEMLVAQAILGKQREQLLAYHPAEQPLALQIGGSNPQLLQQSAMLAADEGFVEVNLNVGCPSPRVSAGRFGACLMLEPALVADCVAAMQKNINIPVTVKTRLGVDQQENYEALWHFIHTVSQAPCQTFILHARKAWLKGLSPKENREIPPLRYDWVYQLKQDFPHLQIVINGGITEINQIKQHLQQVDGVMVGREAYNNPYFLAAIDKEIFGDERIIPSREEVAEIFFSYLRAEVEKGGKLSYMSRHLQGLYAKQPGAKKWRQTLHTLDNAAITELALPYFLEWHFL